MFRLIQISVKPDQVDVVAEIVAKAASRAKWRSLSDDKDDQRVIFSIVLARTRTQEFLDAVSDQLGKQDWQLVTSATEVVLPDPDAGEEAEELEAENLTAAREEIYAKVAVGAELSTDYLVLVVLATLVAAIGLSSGQVAVVIGAMVIAPLLGPILAFAFGTALGNRRLLWKSAKSFGVGFAVSLAAGIGLGLILPGNLDSALVQFQHPLGLTTAALPLASGAAAALMVSRSDTSALVGVMVAAALLPPLAAIGLLLGGGEYEQAARAMATVFANIVAITLAAQVVFIWKGIRPRGWLSDTRDNSMRWNLAVWAVLLLITVGGLVVFGGAGLQ